MRLYLVQHAEALPKEVDPDRPLSEKGRKEAHRLAEFVGKHGVRVSRVLHSGKRRARETAELLAETISSKDDIEASSGLDPNDPIDPFAEQLSRWEQDVAVVGHLPFMDKLVADLVAGSEDHGTVAFQPGAMVCLERAETGGWTIAWMLRPELLA
jgi:phosphohistidine phosphatase